MKRILIGGYYGGGNLGDEAILDCMLRDMRALGADLSFSVISWNPAETSKQYAVDSFHWKDINALLDAGQQADMIILGGGGLFQDYWEMDPKTYLRTGASGIPEYGSLPLLASILGIPCMIYAVGVGPLHSELAREHTRLAFERSQVATVRDVASLDLLRQAGFKVREGSGQVVEVLADPVFSLTSSENDDAAVSRYLRQNKIEDKDLIGVNLRYWDRPGPLWVWLPYVAEGLNAFLTENPHIQVILIPFQTDPTNYYNDDSAVLKNLSPFISDPRRVHLIERTATPRYTQAFMKRCQLILGMRLHAAVLALNEAVPVVALSYDPKVTSLMNLAGLGDYCFDTLTPRPEELTARLQHAWDGRGEIRAAIQPLRGQWRQAAQRNAALAMDLLSQAKRVPSDFARQFALRQIRLQVEVDSILEQRTQEKRSLQEQLWEANALFEQQTRDRNAIIEQKTQEIHALAEQNKRENAALQVRLSEKEALVSSLNSQVASLTSQVKSLSSRADTLASQEASLLVQVDNLTSQLKEIEASKFLKLARLYYRLAQSRPFRHLYRFMTHWKKRGLGRAIGNTVETVKEKVATAPARAIVPALNARPLKGVFVVTSAFVFDELYNQRVINLSKYLSKEGWGVIYVAWRWSKDDAMPGIGEEVYPNIFQIPVDMFLEYLSDLEALEHPRKYFVIEFPHPLFLAAALQLRRVGFPIIYEIIDDWEEFQKVGQCDWFTMPVEKAMVLNANVLTAVSQPLVAKYADLRSDVRLLPNGYDPSLLGMDHGNIARNNFKQDEIHLGYFGHLTDSWFDWDFILRVLDMAEVRGLKLHFHLIGYGGPNLEERLENYRDRVTLYGKVQPSNLYQHAKKWDAAIIPFRSGKLSEAVDPIKIYEYLYFGLPVIVTGITHLKALPSVHVVTDENQFLEVLNMLKEEATGHPSVSGGNSAQKVARVLAESTWEHRFSDLLRILETEEWMSL